MEAAQAVIEPLLACSSRHRQGRIYQQRRRMMLLRRPQLLCSRGGTQRAELSGCKACCKICACVTCHSLSVLVHSQIWTTEAPPAGQQCTCQKCLSSHVSAAWRCCYTGWYREHHTAACCAWVLQVHQHTAWTALTCDCSRHLHAAYGARRSQQSVWRPLPTLVAACGTAVVDGNLRRG